MAVFGQIQPQKIASLPRETKFDLSFVNDIDRILTMNKLENKRVQNEKDSLAIIRTTNNMLSKRTELYGSVKETGEYSGLVQNWDNYIQTLKSESPDDMTPNAIEKRDLIIDSEYLRTKSLFADVQNTYRNDDLTNEIMDTITTVSSTAIDSATNLSEADMDIDFLINSLPGKSFENRKHLKKLYKDKLTSSSMELIIKSDPQAFLNNISIFENRLSAQSLSLAKKQANTNIKAAKEAAKKTNSARLEALNIEALDSISSIEETGQGYDSSIAEQFLEMNENNKRTAFLKASSLALDTYIFDQKTRGIPFDEQRKEALKLKPSAGENNFADKQEAYVKADETVNKNFKEYISDPVLYMEKQPEIIPLLTDENKFYMRAAYQERMGTDPEQFQLFSNVELQVFENEWEDSIQNRGNNISMLLAKVPPEYRDRALETIPIPSEYKTAYAQSEGSAPRLNLMYSALNTDAYKLLSKYQKEKVNSDISDFREADNNYLSYYNRMSTVTGDSRWLNHTADITALFQKVAYSYKLKNLEDITTDSSNLIFGKNVTVISNNTVIGIDSPETSLDEDVQDSLQERIQTADFSSIYSTMEKKMFRDSSSIWIQTNTGYELWDINSRTYILDRKSEPIYVSFSDLSKEFERIDEERRKDRELKQTYQELLRP